MRGIFCFIFGGMKESIEDSFNTEKNRGYHYKHAYSYNWNAMQGFHLLMRLGHAINALSAFTKKLKQYTHYTSKRELRRMQNLKIVSNSISQNVFLSTDILKKF